MDKKTISLEPELVQPALYLSAEKMPAQRGEIPCLDGIRAASIMLVLSGHFIDKRIPGGLGVIFFFLISGFLITRLMISEHRTTGTVALGQFYARRLLRLYPVIIVYSAIIVAVAFSRGLSFNLIEPISALFYFANYYYSALFLSGQRATLAFTIFWSLSIEEHFYFVFPFLFVFLKGNIRTLIICMLCASILCLAARFLMAGIHAEYVSSEYFYLRTEYRIDSLTAGVLMALSCESAFGRRFLKALSFPGAIALSLAVLLLCLTWRDDWFRETLRYSLLNAAAFGLIAAFVFSDRMRFLNEFFNYKPVIFVGRLSYSLYVWHLGVAFFLGTNQYPYLLRLALEFGGAAIVAYLSYTCVERPFLRLRTYFGAQKRA